MEIKIFKRKRSFKKGGLHSDPNIFWEALLLLGFSVFVASCVFGFYLFRTISQKFTSLGDQVQSETRTVSKERINKILEYFSDKQQRSSEIINSPSPIVDPSR